MESLKSTESAAAPLIKAVKKLSLIPIKEEVPPPVVNVASARGRGRGRGGRGGRGAPRGARGRGGSRGRGRGANVPAAPVTDWHAHEDDSWACNWDNSSAWDEVQPAPAPVPSFTYRGGGGRGRGGAVANAPRGPSGNWGGRGRGQVGVATPPFASAGGRGAPIAPADNSSIVDRTRQYRNKDKGDRYAPSAKQLSSRPSAMDFPALPKDVTKVVENDHSAELVKKEKKKSRKDNEAPRVHIPTLLALTLDVIAKSLSRAIPNRSDVLYALPPPLAERLLAFLKTKGHVTNPIVRLFFTPSSLSLDLTRVALSTETLLRIPHVCNGLRALNLSGCAPVITNPALKRLFAPKGSLALLEELNLSDCHYVTDAGLRCLTGRSSLLSLTLTNCRNITDQGISDLKCQNLQRVILKGCNKLTDLSVVALVDQAGDSLVLIDISSIPGITEKSLKLLGERCQMLEHLILLGARLASGAVKDFKQNAPHVKDLQVSFNAV